MTTWVYIYGSVSQFLFILYLCLFFIIGCTTRLSDYGSCSSKYIQKLLHTKEFQWLINNIKAYQKVSYQLHAN